MGLAESVKSLQWIEGGFGEGADMRLDWHRSNWNRQGRTREELFQESRVKAPKDLVKVSMYNARWTDLSYSVRNKGNNADVLLQYELCIHVVERTVSYQRGWESFHGENRVRRRGWFS